MPILLHIEIVANKQKHGSVIFDIILYSTYIKGYFMKKLYRGFIFSILAIAPVIGSQNPDNSSKYDKLDSGRLPQDFYFKKCEPNDTPCLETRTSFISQFAKYVEGNSDRLDIVTTGNRFKIDIEQGRINVSADSAHSER